MLLGKICHYLHVAIVLLVVATEGGRSRRRKSRRSGVLADEPFDSSSSIDNICDIESPLIIYCYCNTIDRDKAEEGNCWIFNDTSDESFADVWEGFSTQTKIRHLTLHLRPDGTLRKIPTVAVMHLPDLQIFEVQYATIQTAHSFCFGNSSSLEKVSLARNSIKVLEPHSFANLPSLSTVSLGENHLTEISRAVFSNLPKLSQLFIDRNNITNIEDNAFVELKNLQELELFSNQIQAIVPETFKGLRSLRRLDLHKNGIEVLGDLTFQDLKSLEFLDLKGNSLKYIAPKSFFGLAKLQRLILQDNKLLSLGSEVFKYTTNLLKLDLRQNVLETLTEDTIQPLLPNLKKEDMQIHLEGNTFRCDTRLLWIFSLYNVTKSRSVKLSLEEVFCYLETGTLPPRLEGVDPTPLYEITTLGIGPRTDLLKLLPSELPDPLIRTPATFTQDEDCEEEDKGDKRGKDIPRGRKGKGGKSKGKGKKPTNETSTTQQTPSDPQNDMANPQPHKDKPHKVDNPPHSLPQPEVRREVRPAAPVQESRSYSDNTTSGSVLPLPVANTLSLAVIMLVIVNKGISSLRSTSLR